MIIIDRRCASLSLSTLPGPTSRLLIDGNRVNSIAFAVPPTIDLHAFCTLLSYNDQVTVTLTLDSLLFSKEQGDALLENFNEDLKKIVQGLAGEETPLQTSS